MVPAPVLVECLTGQAGDRQGRSPVRTLGVGHIVVITDRHELRRPALRLVQSQPDVARDRSDGCSSSTATPGQGTRRDQARAGADGIDGPTIRRRTHLSCADRGAYVTGLARFAEYVPGTATFRAKLPCVAPPRATVMLSWRSLTVTIKPGHVRNANLQAADKAHRSRNQHLIGRRPGVPHKLLLPALGLPSLGDHPGGWTSGEPGPKTTQPAQAAHGRSPRLRGRLGLRGTFRWGQGARACRRRGAGRGRNNSQPATS